MTAWTCGVLYRYMGMVNIWKELVCLLWILSMSNIVLVCLDIDGYNNIDIITGG